MADDPLKIYYQVDRKRLTDASGLPLPQGFYPTIFFTSAPQVEIYLRNGDNQPFTLPSEVSWCVDVDVDFDSTTAPMMRVVSDNITVENSIASFRLITATNETQTVLGTKAKLQTTLLLRAYAAETINDIESEITKFAVVIPLMVHNVLNHSGALPGSIDLNGELIEFLSDHFVEEESDPVFSAWLAESGGVVIPDESDPVFSAWLDTEPLYTKEQITGFAAWAAGHIPVSGTSLYQPVKYIEGADGILYLTKDGDPVTAPWEI